MDIQKLSIEKLNPSAYNPRKDLKPGDAEYEKLRRSIEEFGYVEPIIWNRQTGNVVGGHQRLKVLRELGQTEIDCIVVDLDEPREKALNLALNKISGAWDEDALRDVLASMDEAERLLSGFDIAEIDALLRAPGEIVEDNFDADAALGEKDEPTTARGDIWLLGRHRLMCGDSTSAADISALMSGATAELLFTSPPYSDMREYEGGKDLSVSKIAQFIPAYKPYAKYQAVNLGLQRRDHEIYCYWNEYLDIARQCGYKLMAWNVWDKLMCGSVGMQSAFVPIRHEWIFVFGTEPKDINLTWEKRQCSIRDKRKQRQVRQPDGSLKYTSIGDTSKPFKKMESVLSLAPEIGEIRKEHPATFPIGLPAEYVNSMTNPGDAVIDSFGGSGSTLIACEQTGRICYMMELEPKYCDVIMKRWEQFTGQKAIKG